MYQTLTRKKLGKRQEILEIEIENPDTGEVLEVRKFLIREHTAEKFEQYANLIMETSEAEQKRLTGAITVSDDDLDLLQPIDLSNRIISAMQCGVKVNLPVLKFVLDKPLAGDPGKEKVDRDLIPSDEWILENITESIMHEAITMQERVNGTEDRLKNLQGLLSNVTQAIFQKKIVDQLRLSGFSDRQIFGEATVLDTLKQTPELPPRAPGPNKSSDPIDEAVSSLIMSSGADASSSAPSMPDTQLQT